LRGRQAEVVNEELLHALEVAAALELLGLRQDVR
jgi:hypothetical protein